MSHSQRHGRSGDTAPGDETSDGHEIAKGLQGYLIGLGLATLITIVAFFIAQTHLVWGPSIPIALVVLAVAQIGSRQHQQRPGFGVRRADRDAADHRLAVDHEPPQPQHDAHG
jgi:hypothetical protein